jgi:hypothetical protein
MPADWDALLARQDCVVLVDPRLEENLDRLKSHARCLVDARQHGYVREEGTAHERQESIAAVYTGLVPVVYKAQRTLLESLIESTGWSFVTITPLMMLVSRGIAAGTIVMLPNVLPVLMVFGTMGWLGIPVDIGSMMSASIALGVAVDDTIHFLSWFRSDLNRLGDRRQAILAAYCRCATPTLQAALISGLGLSVFAFSTFTPTQRFGWLMLSILLAGVVAEFIMLPAILAGPLGRVFLPRQSRRRRAAIRPQRASQIPPPHLPTDGLASTDRPSDAGRMARRNEDGDRS